MLKTLLPPGSRARSVAFSLAFAIGLLLYTQVLLPGPGSGAGRGTPTAYLFLGLVQGMVSAITAAGIVLIYRSTRIINFAQVAIGAAGAALVFSFVQYTGVPFWVSFPLGLLVGAGVGLAFDLAIGRRFFNSPRLVLTVFTIAVAGFLASSTASAINGLPFFPPAEDRGLNDILGSTSLRPLLPFNGLEFTVGDHPLPFGFAHVFSIEIVAVTMLLVAAFFRYTRIGVAVRAMAENNERASLLGISVGQVSSVVWAMAGVLAVVGVTCTGMLSTPGTAAGVAPGVLLPALAAAVIARMRSFPITVFAAVALNIFSEATRYSFSRDEGLVDLAFFFVIAIGLLLQRKQLQRSEASGGVAWQATEEVRGVPKELASVPTVKWGRIALIGVGLFAVLVFPWVTSTGKTVLGGVIALNAIVALSLVVLTGWAGQVSLGQVAFAGVGAAVGGSLSAKVGIPFWFAVPLAAAFTGAFAALVGIPALRIRGLFLGITTFAFAVAVRAVLFEPRYFGWLLPDAVERPSLFFLDFTDQRSMYYLCVFALVLAILVVVNLRRSRFGRMLIGLRENEANIQSFGINIVRAKLSAFAMAGALAGFAGAVMAHQAQAVTAESFGAGRSLTLFVAAVVGGIGSIGGAVLGSMYDNVVNFFFSGNVVIGQLQSFIPLVVLYSAPGGLVALLVGVRDAILKIIAQRRQIIVPSLFADYDPDALARRLIPLVEPQAGQGLSALPVGERYALRSELYVGKGERIIDKLAPAKETKEAAAIGAASTSVQDETLADIAQDETLADLAAPTGANT